MGAIAFVIMSYVYPIVKLIAGALNGAMWQLLAFIGINVAALLIFIAAVSPFCTKINARLTARNVCIAPKEKQIRKSDIFSALFKKEMKRIFSFHEYLLNSVAGIIMLIIAIIAMLAFDPINLLAQQTQGYLGVRQLGYVFGAFSLFLQA